MIRVLIVDDSAAIRQVCGQLLSRDPEIAVVGQAPDPYAARDLIVQLRPDVVTLDVEMPRMDGLTFLRKLMRYYPLPVIVFSTLTRSGSEVAFEAMRAGAVDVLCKPSSPSPAALAALSRDLVAAVKAAARSTWRGGAAPAPPTLPPVRRTTLQLIAVGASTGGTVALELLLGAMPENLPATVVVQHMPPVFTASFAGRLDRLCRVRVKEAQDGDAILPGRVLIAPGDAHLVVMPTATGLVASLRSGPRVSGHRPSVDVLFGSVARHVGRRALGVLLTGMGADGAAGLLEMRRAGAHTFAQDEATSVVYGMPRAAAECGAAEHIVALPQMAQRVVAAVEGAAHPGTGVAC